MRIQSSRHATFLKAGSDVGVVDCLQCDRREILVFDQGRGSISNRLVLNPGMTEDVEGKSVLHDMIGDDVPEPDAFSPFQMLLCEIVGAPEANTEKGFHPRFKALELAISGRLFSTGEIRQLLELLPRSERRHAVHSLISRWNGEGSPDTAVEGLVEESFHGAFEVQPKPNALGDLSAPDYMRVHSNVVNAGYNDSGEGVDLKARLNALRRLDASIQLSAVQIRGLQSLFLQPDSALGLGDFHRGALSQLAKRWNGHGSPELVTSVLPSKLQPWARDLFARST